MRRLHSGSSEERQFLLSLIARRAPDLLPIAEKIGTVPLTDEEKSRLWDPLVDEVCENGLDADDEPTEYGLFVERVIDYVNHS